MIGPARVSAFGACIHLEGGKTLVDYVMDGGSLLAGHAHPDISADVGATQGGLEPRDPYDGPHVLAASVEDAREVVRNLEQVHPGLVVSDEAVHYGRVDPVAGWDVRVIGPAAAAGMAFAAVVVRDGALLDGVALPQRPAPEAVAAAGAVGRVVGPLVVAQLSGRSERLAFGVVEVGVAAGLEVRAEQPGGWLELLFGDEEAHAGVPATFSAEMRARGFLVPETGPWWPSLAHDYFMIEHTVDAAAAAMAVAAAST